MVSSCTHTLTALFLFYLLAQQLSAECKKEYDDKAIVLNQLPDPSETKPPSNKLERFNGVFPPGECSFCQAMSTTHYCMSADESTGCVLIDGDEEKKICGRAVCIICRESWSEYPMYSKLDESAQRQVCICHVGDECHHAGRLRKRLLLPLGGTSKGQSWVNNPAFSTGE